MPISSIRFVLALWVVIGHFGVPILQGQQHVKVLWMVRAFLNNAFNGPAAVIVFFVISGFCIHYPNRRKLEVASWRMYYARRYLRILIPMSAAIALSLPLHMEFGLFTESILWSLLCEEIYYLLYPVLLALRDRMGWRNLMTLAWGLALLTVFTNPLAREYPAYGPGLNWVLGLPCWLLGCKLAERVDSFSSLPISTKQIWTWRGTAFLLSVLLSALRFHTPLGYPWTLSLFAVFAAVWLEREIRYYRAAERGPLFESFGEASYSIYLTHLHGVGILHALSISETMTPVGLWVWSMILCGSFATSFYWIVERPSHRFARRFAKQASWLRAAPAVSTR